ncbi:hypothetical protein C8N43_0354 [Litoreibacter ponti]|uniref:Uncharacterized protein n=1 Tax=Litoreibacter ponti TaxID=1510457 RepID=A0A2T6BI17_9RHOB|nr:hypothetical protein [Litoreibacter ponti]PTX55713.1 hypothetical protein C8N43_0354 [Litoreibacter ponti]
MWIRALCLALLGLATPTTAQVQIGGDCAINIANIGENATVNVERGTCGDSFRISYVWLDAQSLNLVRTGLSTQNLTSVVGSKPKILRAGVHDQMMALLELGTDMLPIPQSEEDETAFLNVSTPLGPDDFESDFIDRRALGVPFPMWAGNRQILWPDAKAYSEFFLNGVWPSNYAYCYANTQLDPFLIDDIELFVEDGDVDQLMQSIAFALTPVRFIDEAEFQNYFRGLRDMVEAFDAVDTAKAPLKTAEQLEFAMPRVTARDWRNATPKSYTLLRQITREGFPADFLLKIGEYTRNSTCGEDGNSLGFKALPREMEVMVAVIEPISPSIRITEIGLLADRDTGLRADFDLQRERSQKANLPALVEGDSYLLPLRIEFRYQDRSKNPPWSWNLPLRSQSEGFYEALDAARTALPELSRPAPDTLAGAGATLAGLTPPVDITPTPTYYFGDVLGLESLTTFNPLTNRTTRHQVRETPRFAALTQAGFETGSCPFLAFETASGTTLEHGQVLVGAHAPELAKADTVAIPAGTTVLHLSEREPEISYISEITLTHESGETRTLARDVRLNPQETISIDVPDGWDGAATVTIAGHYTLLN